MKLKRERILRRVALLALVLALFSCAFLAWKSRDMPFLGSLHDDSIYWVSAKSLAEDNGYRISSLPGQPYQTKYPPVYPLLLSLVWRVSPHHPENLPWAMAVDFAILCLLILVLKKLFRQFAISEPAALMLCAIFCLNPYVNLLAISLMSELLFLLLITSSMVLAEAASKQSGWRLAAGAGILAGLAYLTRTAGLPLLVTTPLVFVIRRQYQNALTFAICLAPSIPGWTVWIRLHFRCPKDFVGLYYLDYTSYYRVFFVVSDLPTMVTTNAVRLWNGFAALLGMSLSPWFSAALGLIAVIGTIELVRHSRSWHYGTFALGYLAGLLVWIIGDEGRLLFAVFPLLLAGLWTALSACVLFSFRMLKDHAIWKSIPAFGIILAVVSFVALWLAADMGGLNATAGRAAAARTMLEDLIPAYSWISQHTPLDSIVIARRDCVLYLYTGRRSFFPFPSPRQYYWKSARSFGNYFSAAEIGRAHGAHYTLVLDSDLEGELRLLAFTKEELADQHAYRKIYSKGSASVYEILPR
jgi:hypothetical protein